MVKPCWQSLPVVVFLGIITISLQIEVLKGFTRAHTTKAVSHKRPSATV